MSFEWLRQLRYPKALRIPDLGDAASADRLDQLREVLKQLVKEEAAGDAAGQRDRVAPDEVEGGLETLIVGLATEVWRIEKRLSFQLSGEEKKVKRMIAPLKKLLEAKEVAYRDYSGHPYDPDEIWDRVVGGEGTGPFVVREMAEPRVFVGGRVVKRGAPIVDDASEAH